MEVQIKEWKLRHCRRLLVLSLFLHLASIARYTTTEAAAAAAASLPPFHTSASALSLLTAAAFLALPRPPLDRVS